MVDSKRIENAVVEILSAIGEDPTRDELLTTPKKVAEAFAEFFKGVGVDEKSALTDTFAAEHNDVVILKDIEFVSICEHHLLPFTGVAHILCITLRSSYLQIFWKHPYQQTPQPDPALGGCWRTVWCGLVAHGTGPCQQQRHVGRCLPALC